MKANWNCLYLSLSLSLVRHATVSRQCCTHRIGFDYTVQCIQCILMISYPAAQYHTTRSPNLILIFSSYLTCNCCPIGIESASAAWQLGEEVNKERLSWRSETVVWAKTLATHANTQWQWTVLETLSKVCKYTQFRIYGLKIYGLFAYMDYFLLNCDVAQPSALLL